MTPAEIYELKGYEESRTKSISVLVVDDEYLQRVMTEDMMRAGAYGDLIDVVQAESYTDALQKYSNMAHEPDFVLSDFSMGNDGSGITLAQQLRKTGYEGDIIIMSGASDMVPREIVGAGIVTKVYDKSDKTVKNMEEILSHYVPELEHVVGYP